MKFSFYPAGLNKIISKEVTTLHNVYSLIKTDQWLKDRTEVLRSFATKEDQDKFKCRDLESVTFGGIFTTRRDQDLVEPSGLVCIDLDDLDDPELLKKSIIESSPFILLALLSPRGAGLKLIFRCHPDFTFKENYFAYSAYLISEFKVPKKAVDSSCASISKACLLCHDPEVYINPFLDKGEVPYISAELFQKKAVVMVDELDDAVGQQSWINLFESPAFLHSRVNLDFNKPNSIENFKGLCQINVKKHGKFEEGKRHAWVLSLAQLCNAFGMEELKAVSHFKQLFKGHQAITHSKHAFDFAIDLERPYKDVYEKFKDQFGSWVDNSEEFETPTLPDSIFDRLPLFLRRYTTLYEEKRERDILLLGMITLLSTCFPMIQGVYFRKRVRANLYLFICAPPGSGKGSLSDIRTIGNGIHQSFRDRYEAELQMYESLPEDERKKEKRPKRMQFFIPANNTSAKMIQSISANKLFGILMDTEADTLTNANKSEHGHFSEILRKGFHHESIEYERKLNDENEFVINPAFSILLSGTPNQVQRLVGEVENGLTSRFIYYRFTSTNGWKDVFPKSEDLSYVFKSASSELYNLAKPFLFDFLENPDAEILFDLTERQKESLNSWFSEKTKCLEGLYGPDIKAAVFRLGLIVFRISMILAIVRKAESSKDTSVDEIKRVTCTDPDFDTAMEIISPLLHHTVSVYNLLKKSGRGKKPKNQRQIYIDNLPDEFDRKIAMEVAALLEIKEKTAENYLAWAVSSELLEKVKHNHYKKRVRN
jgi:hypothetical protein